ncbi:MAG TPA: cation:proton antiporter [Ilumatobacteraceae bacterium]
MTFGTLALLAAAGLLGPLIASLHRLAPPAVVGEIAAGVVVGHTGLGWLNTDDASLKLLSQVGFALLMFIVGTHLPLRDARLRSAIGRAAFAALLTAALAIGAGFVLAPHLQLDRPLVLAVLIAASSAAIALPVLQGLGSAKSTVVTAWITILDVVTVLAIPLVTPSGRITRVIEGGVLVIAASLLLYLAAHQFLDDRMITRIRRASVRHGWALDLRVSLLMLFAMAWVATRFGTSILIAGFAAGAVVAVLGEPRRVAQQLVGLGEGFLVPIFFVDLGAQLDLHALVRQRSAIVLGLVLLAANVVVHTVTASIFRLRIGAGLLACAQLGVPSAIVAIGLQTKLLTPAGGAAVMGAVLASIAVCTVGAAVLGHHQQLTDHAAPNGATAT